MIGRPLSPLRKITFRRPSPDTVSFVVAHVTRKPPVSLVKVSVCLSPRPDQEPTCFHATRARGGLGSGFSRHPPMRTAAKIPRQASFSETIQTLHERSPA